MGAGERDKKYNHSHFLNRVSKPSSFRSACSWILALQEISGAPDGDYKYYASGMWLRVVWSIHINVPVEYTLSVLTPKMETACSSETLVPDYTAPHKSNKNAVHSHDGII
jgi:hypothetical protein